QRSPLFPYTTLFRSHRQGLGRRVGVVGQRGGERGKGGVVGVGDRGKARVSRGDRAEVFGEGVGVAGAGVAGAVEVHRRRVVDRGHVDRGGGGVGVEQAVVGDHRHRAVGGVGVLAGVVVGQRAQAGLELANRRRTGEHQRAGGAVVGAYGDRDVAPRHRQGLGRRVGVVGQRGGERGKGGVVGVGDRGKARVSRGDRAEVFREGVGVAGARVPGAVEVHRRRVVDREIGRAHV